MTKIEIALMILGASAVIAMIQYFARRKEKDQWNQGYCLTCGEEWNFCAVEASGKKLYRCSNNHFIHVSYDGIDN